MLVTRRWKMRMPLYRRFEPDARVLEYTCVEFVEQLRYGPLGVRAPGGGGEKLTQLNRK